MWLERVGDNLFSWMRTFAVLCLAIAGVAAWTGGWTLAAPPLRAGLLMGLAGWAPAIVMAAFQVRQRRELRGSPKINVATKDQP